jgi:anti-sigma factor RsiW
MNLQSPERHYSEADLLETYYTQPGASMPVMMHLADCSDCATRYERLEKKVRGLAACDHDEKPETFWSRQRISVMRKIDAQRSSSWGRVSRIAAAAVLVAGLGGWFASSRLASSPQFDPQPPAVATAYPPTDTSVQVSMPSDPWDSEELDEYHSLVAWESWEDQS